MVRTRLWHSEQGLSYQQLNRDKDWLRGEKLVRFARLKTIINTKYVDSHMKKLPNTNKLLMNQILTLNSRWSCIVGVNFWFFSKGFDVDIVAAKGFRRWSGLFLNIWCCSCFLFAETMRFFSWWFLGHFLEVFSKRTNQNTFKDDKDIWKKQKKNNIPYKYTE